MATRTFSDKKVNALPLRTLREQIVKKKIQPFYYLFGPDRFGIDKATQSIIELVSAEVHSDFDKYVLVAGEVTLGTIMATLLSNSFGMGKKYVLVKEFDKLKTEDKKKKDEGGKGKKKGDKKDEFFKPFSNYINSPLPDTVVILQGGESGHSANLEFMNLLEQKGFLFEARQQTDEELAEWVCNYARVAGKKIEFTDAKQFVEVTGTNRLILEEQLKKAVLFVGENPSITLDVLLEQTVKMREFNVFQLLDAIARYKKQDAFKIMHNLINRRESEFQILAMITRFFYTTLLYHDTATPAGGIQPAKVTGYYYGRLVQGGKVYSLPKLKRISASLMEADARLKLGGDALTVLTVLFADIFSD